MELYNKLFSKTIINLHNKKTTTEVVALFVAIYSHQAIASVLFIIGCHCHDLLTDGNGIKACIDEQNLTSHTARPWR